MTISKTTVVRQTQLSLSFSLILKSNIQIHSNLLRIQKKMVKLISSMSRIFGIRKKKKYTFICVNVVEPCSFGFYHSGKYYMYYKVYLFMSITFQVNIKVLFFKFTSKTSPRRYHKICSTSFIHLRHR